MASTFKEILAMRSVDSFLGNGINTPIGKYKLGAKGEDNTKENKQFEIGELLGFDKDGNLVPAERNLQNNVIPNVVGVVTEASTVTIVDPRYMPKGKTFKEVGDFQELYKEFKLLNVRNCQIGTVADTFTWTKKDIGTAVYLVSKTDGGNHIGALTTDFTGIANGKEYQKIGILGDPARREILVSLDDKVHTKA